MVAGVVLKNAQKNESTILKTIETIQKVIEKLPVNTQD